MGPLLSQASLGEAHRPDTDLPIGAVPMLSSRVPPRQGAVFSPPAVIGAEQQAVGAEQQAATAELPGVSPAEEPPLVVIWVLDQESITARSVQGDAQVSVDREQTGLADSRLLIATSGGRLLQLESLRRIDGLALSVLDRAGWTQQGGNQAVDNSLILGNSGSGSYWIEAADLLSADLRGSGISPLRLSDSVSGLRRSALIDPAGADRLTITAGLRLSLGNRAAAAVMVPSQPAAETSAETSAEPSAETSAQSSAEISAGQSSIAGQAPFQLRLLSTALDDSTVQLGDGDNLVTITSSVDTRVEPSPFAEPLPSSDPSRATLASWAGTAPSGWPSSSLGGRAVGLNGSRLDSGGGGDQISIQASGTEAVALQDSQVLLGSGDDRLLLNGDGRQSLIDGGPGLNRIEVNGRLEGMTLQLHPDGRDILQLDGASDSLLVQGSGDLQLSAGGGEDCIRLAGAATGTVDGGAGDDRLEVNPLLGRPGSLTLRGGSGRDLFVLSGLAPLLGAEPEPAAAVADQPSQPVGTIGFVPAGGEAMGLSLARGPGAATLCLPDLKLEVSRGGVPRLSDRLALDLTGRLGSAIPSGSDLVELALSGVEGLGVMGLLPIAPLQTLLSGIGTGPAQLAIALGADGSDLMLLRSPSSHVDLASLPAIRGGLSSFGSPPTSVADAAASSGPA